MTTWKNLIEFIQCLSQQKLTQAEVEYVLSFAKKDVPWDHVVMLASMQGVDGFVYDHIYHEGLLNVLPYHISNQLEDNYHKNRERAIRIINEARVLSSNLQQARIPVVALQGLSLINTLYSDFGLRPLGDIDLMVKPDDKKRLKELLYHKGYGIPYPPYPDLLLKDDILIDLHTHILNMDRIRSRRYLFREDLSPMWERSKPFFDQPYGLLSPDPHDNIIALAAHALKHSYSRLIWIADIHECLLKWTGNTDRWKAFVERTLFWHQERSILYALILVENIFRMKIPFWVKRRLGIEKLGLLERHLIRLKIRGFSSDELCIVLWLFHIKGFRKKMEFIKETIFPKDDIISQIFEKDTRKSKASLYAKRVGQVLTLIINDLQQFLDFSFRSNGNF